MRRVHAFHVGPPKTATTWIYRCLAAHPQIAAPPRDSVHFFDMHHARGVGWYLEHYASAQPDQVLFDPTPSYLRSPWAARRIAEHDPDARIAVCLRHPLERAFSHYWHEKKKGRQRYGFAEVLDNYDLFSAWLEPGFYAEHLERYLAHFDRSQLLVQRFEDVAGDPRGFLRALQSFYGVDAAFVPETIDTPVNVAGPRHDAVGLGLHSVQKALRLVGLRRGAERLSRSPRLSGRGEYVRGLDGVAGPVVERLRELCDPEIDRLERLLSIDLSAWQAWGIARAA